MLKKSQTLAHYQDSNPYAAELHVIDLALHYIITMLISTTAHIEDLQQAVDHRG